MTTLYAANPTMFKSNPIRFIVAILLIPLFGIGILILLIWFLRCRAAKLTITENEILHEKGILSKVRSEVGISSVRATKIKQSLLNRIFNVGTIEIYTAGDTPEFTATGLPDPNKVRDLIKARQNLKQ